VASDGFTPVWLSFSIKSRDIIMALVERGGR
jgi:hypothetical protein